MKKSATLFIAKQMNMISAARVDNLRKCIDDIDEIYGKIEFYKKPQMTIFEEVAKRHSIPGKTLREKYRKKKLATIIAQC